jgi:hypothetical protein
MGKRLIADKVVIDSVLKTLPLLHEVEDRELQFDPSHFRDRKHYEYLLFSSIDT